MLPLHTFIVHNMYKTEEKKLHHTCIKFQEPYTNILKQKYMQESADLFTFTKEIPKENISCSVRVKKTSLCLELRLKKKSQFQKITFIRDFDFDFDTYLCSFLTHFHARWYQNVIRT